MERCVRCGSCKATCPTYDQSVTEGMSARGRVMLVRALLKGELEHSKELAQRLYSCLLCGLCEPPCPVGVDVTGIVYLGLSELGGLDPRGRVLRNLTREGFLHPKRTFGVGKILNPLLGPVAKKVGIVPFDIKLPKTALRAGHMEFSPEGEPVGKVAIFVGCATNFIYPQQGQALIDILLKLGLEVVMPEGEVCCGAPLRSMGMEEDAVELARANIEAFNSIQADAVLSPCPTCTLAIKKHYPELVGDEIKNAMDPAEFLLGRADHLQDKGDAPPQGVMYHEPCHLATGLGAGDPMRELLLALGIEFTEPTKKTCCGFSQAGVYPEVSDAQLDPLAKEYARAGTLITSCPGCIAQLSRRHGNVRHILELISLRGHGPLSLGLHA